MLKMDSQKRTISNIPQEKNYAYSNQLNIPSYQDALEESMRKANLFSALEREKSEEFEKYISEGSVQVDKVVEQDVSLVNENNNENARSLSEDLRDSTQDLNCVSPGEDISKAIGRNSPQTPRRYIDKELKLQTPVPSISVVPPSDEESLAKHTMEIVDTKEAEAMVNHTDQEIIKAKTNARNVSQNTDVHSDVEAKSRDSVVEETVSSVNNSSLDNSLKERLQLLNADLDQEHIGKPVRPKKVAFRENLDQCKDNMSDTNDLEKPTKENTKSNQVEMLENSYDMVIERDGRFDLVTPDDMNALISKMKRLPANNLWKQQKSTKVKIKQQELKKPRPLTANVISQTPLNVLEDRPFSSCTTYLSPYALTAEQKEAVQKKLRMDKEKMRRAMEEEKAKEEEKRQINQTAFECWLNQAKEKEIAVKKQWKLQEEMEKNTKEEDERMKKDTNIHRKWVQKKHKQVKQEELLRKRQQQEIDSVRKCRSQEEIESAYQRWLENKYLEKRKQKYLKKQKNWFHHRLLQRSRLIKNMTWNLCLNHSFRYKEPRNSTLKLKRAELS